MKGVPVLKGFVGHKPVTLGYCCLSMGMSNEINLMHFYYILLNKSVELLPPDRLYGQNTWCNLTGVGNPVEEIRWFKVVLSRKWDVFPMLVRRHVHIKSVLFLLHPHFNFHLHYYMNDKTAMINWTEIVDQQRDINNEIFCEKNSNNAQC